MFTHQTFGEVTDSFIPRGKADGLGVLSDADKFPVVYIEGSRPVPKKGKEFDDATKVATKMVVIQESTLEHLCKHHHRAPEFFATFGGQSIGTQIQLLMLEYYDHFFLHEIETASVPRDFTETLLFVEFYEAILTWAGLVVTAAKSFRSAKLVKRASRLSYYQGMKILKNKNLE